jgi:transcription elongation factor Elf1
MELETTFVCAFCLHVNETTVDPTGGTRQEYVEDCQICCRPNLLQITVDPDARTAEITAVPS